MPWILRSSACVCSGVASSLTKTSIMTRFLRFVAPWLRLSRVTSTAPRIAVEMNTVITAAMAMTQLRRMEPNASERKKLKRIAHLFGDLVVAAAALVAHEASGLELQDAPAHAVDHVAVVGGDQHGGAGAVDADQELHDAHGRLGVDVARGLVGEEQRRVVDESARHADTLLLAAGDLVRVAVGLFGEAHQAEDLGDLAADGTPRLAHDLERIGDVVVDGLVGKLSLIHISEPTRLGM